MKEQMILGLVTSLTVLGGSVLPVQAQKNIANRPSSNLVNAIAQTIRKKLSKFNWDWNEIKKDITFQYTEVDLNKDGIKETLVSIQRGHPCNYSHCPVYIYQKDGINYRFISYVFTLRDEFKVALLPNSSKGWANIAGRIHRIYIYEPREMAWGVFKFDGKKYQLTSQKLNSPPKNIVLRKTSDPVFNFINSKGR